MGKTREYYNKKWGRYPSTSEDPYNSYFYPFNNSENGLGYFTNVYYNHWIIKESKKEKQNFIEAVVTCLCGNSFKSMSVSGGLEVNTCAACDPAEFMQDGTKQ